MSEESPMVWEVTRRGLPQPAAIAGYPDADRHLAVTQFVADDDAGWDGDAYDHTIEIRRNHPDPEDRGQIYKVLIFRSIIEERKRRG